jgi:methionyl-tRNA formyltransferase
VNLRVVFMGSPVFAVPTLRALHSHFRVVGVVTQPDKPKGRGQRDHATAVKAAGLDLGIPVLEPERLGTPDPLKALQDWNPDVIVVVAYGKLLPAVVLQLPPMGCVNVHASLLPRHRGASPIPAAILGGDRHTGVSTMLLDEGMDTGDVLLKRQLVIEETDTAGSLHDKLMQLGADLAVETVRQMMDKKLKPIPQDPAEATYTRPLAKNDGRLNWTADAGYLDRVVRAMNPWPVAFFRSGGDDIKVWRAGPVDGEGEPGRVVEILGDGIAVGTGKGLLSLREVQAPGKKRVSATDFARGRRLHAGDVLE